MKALNVVGTAMLALAFAGSSLAQQGQHGMRNGSGPLIDTAQVVVIDGVVVEFVAGLGQGMPSLEVEANDGTVATYVLGPYWYLVEQGFVAEPGDLVTVTAYDCSMCETGLAVASVVDHTEGVTLALRDASGLPLWATRATNGTPASGAQHGGTGNGHGGMGGGQGGMTGGSHTGQGTGTPHFDMLRPDLAQVATYTGSVVTFSVEAGDGAGTLVLATESGDVSFVLSPVWVLLRAEFEPAVGSQLQVVAAPAIADGETVLVVLTITDLETGLTVVLRDPATGLPISGFGWHGGF